MLTADARARASAWALARRARAWTLAYSGMAIAARIPMIATTIINSMRVKPRWLPSSLCFPCQNFVMYGASVPIEMLFLPPNRKDCLADQLSWRIEGHAMCHRSRRSGPGIWPSDIRYRSGSWANRVGDRGVLRVRRLDGTGARRRSRPESTHAGGGSHPPRVVLRLRIRRYGRLTEVLSPELLMVKVPADCTAVYT